MQALAFDPESRTFHCTELPVPCPGEKEVLIEVDACGLNPVDAKIGEWCAMVPGMSSTWVPGLDVSGHVVDVGPHTVTWKPGDRVLCHGDMFRPHGGCAEYSIQAGDTLIPHPDLDAETAAASPCAGWTAWRALHDKLRAAEHRSLLIAGGSGGVGGFAIQIAAYLGVDQILATCSAANHDYVRSLGRRM